MGLNKRLLDRFHGSGSIRAAIKFPSFGRATWAGIVAAMVVWCAGRGELHVEGAGGELVGSGVEHYFGGFVLEMRRS